MRCKDSKHRQKRQVTKFSTFTGFVGILHSSSIYKRQLVSGAGFNLPQPGLHGPHRAFFHQLQITWNQPIANLLSIFMSITELVSVFGKRKWEDTSCCQNGLWTEREWMCQLSFILIHIKIPKGRQIEQKQSFRAPAYCGLKRSTFPPRLFQESYVWKMYQERCWDFFPAGDCFRKQYEDQLG